MRSMAGSVGTARAYPRTYDPVMEPPCTLDEATMAVGGTGPIAFGDLATTIASAVVVLALI